MCGLFLYRSILQKSADVVLLSCLPPPCLIPGPVSVVRRLHRRCQEVVRHCRYSLSCPSPCWRSSSFCCSSSSLEQGRVVSSDPRFQWVDAHTCGGSLDRIRAGCRCRHGGGQTTTLSDGAAFFVRCELKQYEDVAGKVRKQRCFSFAIRAVELVSLYVYAVRNSAKSRRCPCQVA